MPKDRGWLKRRDWGRSKATVFIWVYAPGGLRARGVVETRA